MHKDIQDVKKTMNSILRNQNAELANQIEHEPVQEICYVKIPDSLLGRMEGMLGRRQSLGLPEMADCFLIHLTRVVDEINQHRVTYSGSARYTSQHDVRSASVSNYLTFAKCQILMDKMKRVDELQNPRKMSHWPGYIESLEEVRLLYAFVYTRRIDANNLVGVVGRILPVSR